MWRGRGEAPDDGGAVEVVRFETRERNDLGEQKDMVVIKSRANCLKIKFGSDNLRTNVKPENLERKF